MVDRRETLAQQIGRMESGNNPGIGYHNRSKSTAYGQYGFTDPTWAGLRRTNPLLPADITQATLEQQRVAFDQLSAANGQQLAGYGLPVNPGSIALAHLLGARGARDYIQNGTLSPDASARNGGEGKLRAIAEQRLKLGAPNASPAPDGSPAPGGEPYTSIIDSGTWDPPQDAAPAAAGDDADLSRALNFFGKSLSKMGRDSAGPDAASIVKPRTFADPVAGEMLPGQRARAIAAALQKDMV
jgi:hypothetical protein